MFAIIYTEPATLKEDMFRVDGIYSNLTFSNALYFSSTTITTLSYGDIIPRGIFRYFVVIEAMLGLIYTGIMIYFITKVLGKN